MINKCEINTLLKYSKDLHIEINMSDIENEKILDYGQINNIRVWDRVVQIKNPEYHLSFSVFKY